MNGIIRLLLAVFLIGLGTMLVLGNLGIIDVGVGVFWHHLYPILILAIGLKWLYDYFRKRGTHWFLGLVAVLIGSLLLLDRFEVITFYFKDIFKLWPLLIIYFGFILIGFGRNRRGNFTFSFADDKVYGGKPGKHDGKQQVFAVGSQDYSEPNWKVEPMNINTFAGDFYFDFTKAFIPEEEIPITIRSMAGDVHILMPEHLDFRIEAAVKAGEIDVLGNNQAGVSSAYYFETENYEEATRKIDFYIKLQAGSIRVDQV